MDRKLKILFAEDNRVSALEMTEILEENGYEVQTVHSGVEAWATFQRNLPDIVILDYQMPGMTGLEVFQRIQETHPSIPVLILSSYQEYCVPALKNGTADFIHKEADIEEICARIDAAWQRTLEARQHKNKVYPLSVNSKYNCDTGILYINQQAIPLQGVLGDILALLCQHSNTYLTRHDMCKQLWNNDESGKIKLLSDYISKLRKIILMDAHLSISSSYGKGYCLKIHNPNK